MTQKEREDIQTRSEKAKDAYYSTDFTDSNSALDIEASLDDIDILQDALDAETKRADEAKNELLDYIDSVNITIYPDRDRWKKRAEALERALENYTDCQACGNKQCFKRNGHKNCNWQFDESRFVEDEERHEK